MTESELWQRAHAPSRDPGDGYEARPRPPCDACGGHPVRLDGVCEVCRGRFGDRIRTTPIPRCGGGV